MDRRVHNKIITSKSTKFILFKNISPLNEIPQCCLISLCVYQFYCMSNLDLSDHPLNRSSTKQKYSFPKTKRFQDSNSKVLCESFYDIPSTFARRTTTLGYGKKTMGLENQPLSPGVGNYNLASDINPEKNMRNSISFGLGREQMQLSGAFGHLKVTEKLPAPGSYSKPDDRDKRAHSMRSRLPDHILSKRIQEPGPGTYNHQNLGGDSYYATSKYKNFTNVKISQVSRLDPIGKSRSLGPANYQAIDSLNIQGRYSLSKHVDLNRCIFPKSERKGVVEKNNINFPGPGQYKFFSGFG